jgi:hypothetical protein
MAVAILAAVLIGRLDEVAPIIRSLQPGENWSWCFPDGVAFLIPEVTGETRIPRAPLG